MTGRPRKGQPVTFTAAPSTPDRSAAVLGLRFTIEAQYGGRVLVDMAGFHARSLAVDFAQALRNLTKPGGPVGAASVIRQYVNLYRRFFAWIAQADPHLAHCSDVRASHIDRFAEALEHGGMQPCYLHTLVSKVVNTLRTIEADRPGRIAPDLRQRLRYTLPTSGGRSTPRDAYSPFVARALRDAARADVEAMFRRFSATDSTDASDPALAAARADIEALIEQHGTVSNRWREVRRLYDMRQHRGLPFSIDDLHSRHHLLARDLPALLVLLVLDAGLEPECAKALDVDCLANPHAGTIELRYLKRRARGAEHKTMRVRDGGTGTPGGLVRRLIDVTAVARRHLPSECLWVYHNDGRLRSGIAHPQPRIAQWVARHDIRDERGEPLHLLLSRLRKTHKALWYTKTQGHMVRFAVGHTREVAARHYADLPSLRPLHEATVADAFREAVAQSLPVVLPPPDEDALRSEPEQVASLMPAEAIAPLLEGQQDVWLAACSGFYHGPFAAPGAPCGQPFWGCLDCSNAVITARKLPAILAFLAFLEDQRSGLTGPDWAMKFGHAHARITQQILPAFSDAAIADARAKSVSEDLYLPPEARL